MNYNSLKTWQRIFGIAFLSMYLFIGCAGIAAGQGTVTQPPIIPPAAITKDTKVYIPYDTSGNNKSYLEKSLLPGIAGVIIGITGGLALLFAIVSGIMLLTSYGNTDMASKATKTLTYSLIGVIIAGLSYAIVKIIASINP